MKISFTYVHILFFIYSQPNILSVGLSNEDFINHCNLDSLIEEASPAITSQKLILRHSVQMASKTLLTGDDIADHYVFTKAYKKYFHIGDQEPEGLNNLLKTIDNSPIAMSLQIRLSNKTRTKICLDWIPPNISKNAIFKIISSVLSGDSYTYYVYNVGETVRILAHSKSESAKIPKYIELQNPEVGDSIMLQVAVRQKRILKDKHKKSSRKSV